MEEDIDRRKRPNGQIIELIVGKGNRDFYFKKRKS